MSFFYDLNKKLDAIRQTPSKTHGQLNERDEGKPGKNFDKIAKDAGERYGSKAAGKRVAGAVRNELRDQGKLEEEGMSRAAKGYEKYGKKGMEALAKAGREGNALDPIRKKYDKYDEGQDFGPGREGPNRNQAGPSAISPDRENYKTPDFDKYGNTDGAPGAWASDARGQNKYADRTAPTMVNKIKDKLGYDKPDQAYGPRPDERERLAKRYPAPAKEGIEDRLKDLDPKNPVNIPAYQRKAAEQGRPIKTQEASMTPKQKSFAKLAPPANKITFADKIAGAKKEVDEMLGDVAAEAMRAALGKGKQTVQGMAEDQPTHFEVHYKDNQKGRTAKTKVKGSDAKQAKAAWNDWNSNNTPGRFTFVAVKPVADEMDEAMPPRGKMTPSGKMTPKKFKAVFNGPLDWPRIVKFKDRLMDQGMEPEEAEQAAAERLGFEYEEVLDYLDLMNSTNEENDFTAHQRPAVTQPKVGSTERGHKHDIKHTATGRMVTRRTDPQGNSVGADDASDAQVGPRGRGRPKGTKGAIGAKGPSGKSKLMTKEGDQDITDQGEYDQEGDMAKDDIKTIVRHAQALSRVLGDDDNLPEWVQSKLAKIEGMMISIDEYMQNQSGDDGEEEPIAEKAVSKKQQRFMGMVHAAQKGEKPASKEVGKVAKTMKKKDAEDFASTKHKGLPEKKKKEVDENAKEESPGRLTTTMNSDGTSSTSSSTGRVSATLDNGKWEVKPGAPLTASSDTKQSGGGKGAKTGGMSFGQGIYDSMNRELEQMIAESMSVNMSDSTEGGKSLTITATDEDALKLAMMLRNAGLGGDAHGDGMHSHDEESCPTCGMEDCGCGDVQEAVDENAPDWPTNTEKADNNFGYAGGLNKAKASGMATIPVTDVSLDGEDMFSKPVHEDDELRRMQEMAGIKNEGNIDLGPRSPEIAAMSKDEVDSAIKASISPEVAAMDPDEVNAALGLDQDEQYEESIRRIREMAGIQEAKKDVEEEKTEEGNLFTGNLAKARAAGKKQADLDGDGDVEKVRESIFALNNQWKAYKG